MLSIAQVAQTPVQAILGENSSLPNPRGDQPISNQALDAIVKSQRANERFQAKSQVSQSDSHRRSQFRKATPETEKGVDGSVVLNSWRMIDLRCQSTKNASHDTQDHFLGRARRLGRTESSV
ncbi:hypothetical protein RBSH_03551 [Rhodopirellula baltica SH28]|uniref:Uncharacterized protein n=1 Tax=Rhodopirellula baltica SH28 TaxID=993517 RepID=K5D3G1_RHOBT|nr:hypothetical protein RBSH_03551 [Rhodopirellula baltica SH28]